MKEHVFTLVALLAVVVSAHSFVYDGFSALSEIVLQEVPNHVEEPAIRTRREAQGPNSNNDRKHKRRFMSPPFKYCCGGENNTNFKGTEEMSRIATFCFEKRDENASEWSMFGNPTKDPFSCKRLKEFRDEFYCANDCIMKELGVLRTGGAVDTDVAKLYFTEDLAFDWLKELASEAVEKCATKKDSYWAKNEKFECSTQAVDLKQCVWSEIILTCPVEHQEKSDYCERVKIALEDANN